MVNIVCTAPDPDLCRKIGIAVDEVGECCVGNIHVISLDEVFDTYGEGIGHEFTVVGRVALNVKLSKNEPRTVIIAHDLPYYYGCDDYVSEILISVLHEIGHCNWEHWAYGRLMEETVEQWALDQYGSMKERGIL